MARHSLKNHHLTLMRRLTTSLSTFRETRAEVLSVLPKADPWREPLPYSKCSCIDDVTTSFGEQEVKLDVVPLVTTLRCGLADFTKGEKNGLKPTTEELFHYLEEKVPWLLSPDGLKCEVRSGPCFQRLDRDSNLTLATSLGIALELPSFLR